MSDDCCPKHGRDFIGIKKCICYHQKDTGLYLRSCAIERSILTSREKTIWFALHCMMNEKIAGYKYEKNQ